MSYTRFVELIPSSLFPLCAHARQCCGACTGITFLDSTPVAVCDNHRIAQDKVFEGLAVRGKSSTGWFFGFKLHLLVNDRGELLNFALAPGNVDDRRRLPRLVKHLRGPTQKHFPDRALAPSQPGQFPGQSAGRLAYCRQPKKPSLHLEALPRVAAP